MKFLSLLFAAFLLVSQPALAEDSKEALAKWRKKVELHNQLHACEKGEDLSATFDALNSYAEKGDVVAQNALGDYFSDCAPDAEKAEKWYSKAAEKGYPLSERALASISQKKGNQIDAARWWLKAAEHGDAESQYEIGIKFQNGWGVKKDVDASVSWFKKADAQNHKYAAAEIARIYRDRAVDPDYTEAALWFRRGAELADAYSSRELGQLYQKGLGVQQNFAEAAKWFGIGAAQGDWRSMLLLAGMYEEGKGFAQNWEEAYFWNCLAGDNCPNETPLPPKGMTDDCSSGMCVLSVNEGFSLGVFEDGKHLTKETKVAIAKRARDWKKFHLLSASRKP